VLGAACALDARRLCSAVPANISYACSVDDEDDVVLCCSVAERALQRASHLADGAVRALLRGCDSAC
jgi:hypothetical protein